MIHYIFPSCLFDQKHRFAITFSEYSVVVWAKMFYYTHSLDLLKSFLIKGQCNKVRFIWFWKQNEVRDVLLFSSWDLGTGNARVVCFGVHLNNIFTANMGSQTFVICNICSSVLVSKGFKRALKGRKQYILTSFINYLILALFLQTFLNFFLTL